MFLKVKRERSFMTALSTISTLLILLVSYQNCGKSLTSINSIGRTTSGSLCEGICPPSSPDNDHDDNETLADNDHDDNETLADNDHDDNETLADNDHDDNGTLADNDHNASHEPFIGDSPSSPASDNNGSGENEGGVADDSVTEAENYTPPNELTMLSTLRTGHPRLIVPPEALVTIHNHIKNNAIAKAYFENLRKQADELLNTPVSTQKVVGGKLLEVSRTVKNRVRILSLIYRITENKNYADRAIKELLAAAAFSDWNPKHFLDVAEMSHGFALGYDWLFNILSVAERNTIRTALVEKGLKAAKADFENNVSWTNTTNNWSLVCNGGIAAGALAVADEEPELARWLLYRNITRSTKAFATYAPDGVWPEGPNYWSYATDYAVLMLASLNSALGTDFGLSSLPGLSSMGLYFMHSSGPTGKHFNYSDSSEYPTSDIMLWIGQRYNHAVLSWLGRVSASKSTVDHLFWFHTSGTSQDMLKQPRDVYFKGKYPVVFFRSKWLDSNAAFIGFKGGDNRTSHGNLDLGTFVFDTEGQRWAMELGGDNYDLKNYWRYPERGEYYRCGTQGQNTLLINNLNQDHKAIAPIIHFASRDSGGEAIVDLSAAYAPAGINKVQRGIALLEGRQRFLVVEISANTSVDVVWSMHTKATITIASGAKKAPS